MDETERDTLSVYFNPPLWAQRIAWVLDRIRKYSVRTILDLGCGEGQLLRCLAQPAPYLCDATLPLDVDVSSRDVYPSLMAGIDICTKSLERARAATEPQEMDDSAPRYATVSPRWNPLTIELWHGELEVASDQFLNRFECIVSTEVVEHLPREVLDRFFPLVLGYYRPQFLLLTTPNYNFNELFTKPGEPSPTGYPDPTGDTDRVFRHHDHKREWTLPEWRQWCEKAALQYGYNIEIGCIGVPEAKDPYGRSTSILGKATHTAVFERGDHRQRIIPPSSNDARIPELVACHIHPVHCRAGKPLSAQEIRDRVKLSLSQSPSNELPVEQMWKEDIDIACGGSRKALIDALIQRPSDGSEPEWQITEAGADIGKWLVLWKNWTPEMFKEAQNLWNGLGDVDREEIGEVIDHAWDECSQEWWLGIQQPTEGDGWSHHHWDITTEVDSNWENEEWPKSLNEDAVEEVTV
ncbi:uncharacterized protein EI90DRAFT_3037172 [Cantharellus anzutake]|uniref:uncharacterized protein n=1 Tax=Cantharellus anzutake TaxID=1750568 RepID=UPI0019061958|nr:uncharacterized protein EI90DRAFT_3037172 [Cantharellus anzutake]KAF8339590.1 hypothetical protein EI90DRAFT_3037172 [Cantharellus anzutake]